MLRANFVLDQGQSVTLEPANHSTGWTGTTDAATVRSEVQAWTGQGEKAITLHLGTVRGELKKKQAEVILTLKTVTKLLNEEAAALENLEGIATRRAARKTSREINTKAKLKKAKKAAKAARVIQDARDKEVADVSDSSDDMDEDVKVPSTPAPSQSRSATHAAQPPATVSYTPEQQARLNADWSFAELCYARRCGEHELMQLRLNNIQIPWVAPPQEFNGTPAFHAHMLMQPVDHRPTQPPAVSQPMQPTGVTQPSVAGLSFQERSLRDAMAQNGIEDIRPRVPIMRTPAAQENMSEMAVENSGSDSEGLSTAVASFRVAE